jgi:hypothetical protein
VEGNDVSLSGAHFTCRDVTRLQAPIAQLGATKLAIVAGLLLYVTADEIDVTTLTQSVVFIKETELLLISDHWNVLINFNLTPCVATVKAVQADVLVLKEMADKTAFLGELRHVESALVSLENKLADIRRFAPSPIRKRRGLIDEGGLLLK